MKKFRIGFGVGTVIIVCGFCCVTCMSAWAEGEVDYAKVSEHCESAKEILRNVQREDSRIRVYLGSYYEKVLTKYVTRLNLRLVENNLSQTGLIEGQTNLASSRVEFVEDFIEYQKGLEELVAIDCKQEPKRFYDELEKVREDRRKVAKDAGEVKELILKHKKMVGELKVKLSGKSGTSTDLVEEVKQ